MKTSSRIRFLGADRGAWQGAVALLALVAAAGCGSSPADDGSSGNGGSGGSASSGTGSGGETASGTTASSTTGSGGAGAGGSGSGGADLCAGVVCTASDACHVAGTCDPATGMCDNPTGQNGAACDDGNACTATDTCLGGTCLGANPVVCAAADECHAVGTCDPATGMCSNPDAPDGTACTCGACTSGECGAKLVGPTSTGPGNPRPLAITVDATNVYVGNSYMRAPGLASVASLPKTGAAQATPIATGFTGHPTPVVTFNDLYFPDNAFLWKMPKTGGTPTQVDVNGPGQGYYAMVRDNANVYHSRSSFGDIRAYPLGGGMPIVMASGEAGPHNMDSNGTTLCWVNITDNTIRRKTLPGGAIVTVASGQEVYDVAVDLTNIYWTDRLAGTVNKSPITGGPITIVASGQNDPLAIDVAGNTVYWTNYDQGFGQGQVSAAPITGNGPVIDVPGNAGAYQNSITHDSACIYWTDVVQGKVYSAPRLP